MQRINRKIDTKGSGTVWQVCLAGLFSLLFLLLTGANALAQGCIDCHYQGGIGPMPHTPGCNETSCAQACHTSQDANRHPIGTATPFTSDRTTTCRNCHDKPWPDVYHPYTINVSAGSITPSGSVDLDQACGQCHGGGTDPVTYPPAPGLPYFNKTVLGNFAQNIHFTKPIARISFAYDPAINFKVDFDARNTTCASGSCTYSWNFGDGSPAGSGIQVSYTYSDNTTRNVVLTVVDTVNKTSGTASSPVTPQYANQAPVAVFGNGTPSVSNFTVTVKDASTDDAVFPPNAITVNWGDGQVSTGNAGGSFSHTYSIVGSYQILLTARDAGGLYAYARATVAVAGASQYLISGTIYNSLGAPLSGATVTLKFNNATKATQTTVADGAYSFGKLGNGTYQVLAYKYAMLFDNQAIPAIPYENPVTVLVSNADVTGVNFYQVANFNITVTTTPAVSGAVVYLKQGPALKATGTTDATGKKVFSNLAPGTYEVSVSKTGYTFSAPQSLTGPGNQTADFTHTP